MPPSNLKHLFVKTVNLFKFKKRQNHYYSRVLLGFILWIFFVFFLNGPLRSKTEEKRDIFRSKNLLASKTKTEERNLSEVFSIEQSKSVSNEERVSISPTSYAQFFWCKVKQAFFLYRLFWFVFFWQKILSSSFSLVEIDYICQFHQCFWAIILARRK